VICEIYETLADLETSRRWHEANTMKLTELDYHLPEDRIATRPAEPRDSARLMVVERWTGRVTHRQVRDLVEIAGGPGAGDLMLFNQTRVLKAKFEGVRVSTGGKVGGLYLGNHADGSWDVLFETRGTLMPGEVVRLEAAGKEHPHPGAEDGTVRRAVEQGSSRKDQEGAEHPHPGPLPEGEGVRGSAELELVRRVEAGQWRVMPRGERDPEKVLGVVGQTPLPPYIVKERKKHHEAGVTAYDDTRYNTVYAKEAGSVAAPTAGLHYTPELLAGLEAKGVRRAMLTLHVGIGTFATIKTEKVEEHPIHAEFLQVPGETVRAIAETRRRGGRVFVVGTTSVRAVESLPVGWEGLGGEGYGDWTRLLITPGFEFRFTDCLMTNFHLPRSSLLALVAAMPGVGIERLMGWYEVAVKEGYRFYSYGDAMVIV
jgi:S-adenosylmethionine:tRNA ribosyltransferase-isomerase